MDFYPDVLVQLKSRAQGVRDISRETLYQIISEMGPQYIEHVAREMSGMLNKGFMLHVFGYTLHGLLVHVLPIAQPGDLDHCMALLVEIFMADAVGNTASQKAIKKIAAKTKEAKSVGHSFHAFEILASLCSLPSLSALLSPLSTMLVSTQRTCHERA